MLPSQIVTVIFNQLNMKKKSKIDKDNFEKKKGEIGKKRKVILEKKRKKGKFGKKKMKKNEKVKKKKRNALWITIVIHDALGVGEHWIPHTL